MEAQFNKSPSKGWRFAAAIAKITDEKASSEDRKHTAGGVCVAVDSILGAVFGNKQDAGRAFRVQGLGFVFS